MFVTHNLHTEGKEINQVVAHLGIKVGEAIIRRGSFPAIAGNTYTIKDQIKAAGFRFDAESKCWYCNSFEARDAFVRSLAA